MPCPYYDAPLNVQMYTNVATLSDRTYGRGVTQRAKTIGWRSTSQRTVLTTQEALGHKALKVIPRPRGNSRVILKRQAVLLKTTPVSVRPLKPPVCVHAIDCARGTGVERESIAVVYSSVERPRPVGPRPRECR